MNACGHAAMPCSVLYSLCSQTSLGFGSGALRLAETCRSQCIWIASWQPVTLLADDTVLLIRIIIIHDLTIVYRTSDMHTTRHGPTLHTVMQAWQQPAISCL